MRLEGLRIGTEKLQRENAARCIGRSARLSMTCMKDFKRERMGCSRGDGVGGILSGRCAAYKMLREST